LFLSGILLSVYYIGTAVFWQVTQGLPGPLDFALHHAHYESIVADVKARNAKPGSEGWAGDGRSIQWRRLSSGGYMVTIITKDWFHAGTYGYLYSDTPPIRTDSEWPRQYEMPGILLFLSGRVAPKWWSAYRNVD
jgi:hypothetical protein